MQVLLTEDEYNDLKALARRGEDLANRVVALSAAKDRMATIIKEQWGCIYEDSKIGGGYCGDCPLSRLRNHEFYHPVGTDNALCDLKQRYSK
jgi:hypothetical protein